MAARIDEVEGKLARVRKWLRESDREAVLIASQPNFAWVTAGGDSRVAVDARDGVAAILVTAGGAHLVTNNIELDRLLEEQVAGLPFEPITYPWYEPARGEEVIRRLCDPERAVSDTGAFGVPVAASSIAMLRWSLVPDEIDRFRRLGRDAAEAVEAACFAVRPGNPELATAAIVAAECVHRDIVPLVVLVGADDRIARYRHPLPTSTRVRRTLLVALTGRRHGLHASLTRMVHFGRLDVDLAARHEAVLRADARVNLESRPGRMLSDIFGDLAEQYGADGFANEWQRHHQGGPTGYAGREVFATEGTRQRLGAWQAVAWNPSITRVKSEDTVLVTPDGPEVLTETGRWPQRLVQLPVGTLQRPALLLR